jgi:hypothetical protein
MKDVLPFLYAIEAGGSRNKMEAYNLKKIGVKAGMLDYFLMIPNDDYHGLFIEFKAGKNKLSEEQIKFIEIAESKDYKCVTVWDWKNGIEAIKRYMNNEGNIV